MDARYYTIGMAGHIDHGKTTLTKALTNVETDRLKEEKERSISIELGYAPLHTKEGVHVSIVDVPGHERFIRQMIAGVAGIDLVVLVIAADEGVMPQTKEHLEILQFLGIDQCIVAITKVDQVEEELLDLVAQDIYETLEDTTFVDAPMVFVDSLSGKGVDKLKDLLFENLKNVGFRDRYGSFRLPIDQVFTVQGLGTIVRGTIYEGMVQKSDTLQVLPAQKRVKARNIQVHHQDVEHASAGQRTAINISGIDRDEVKRGDVLVASDHFIVTNTIDVSIRFVEEMRYPLKQRAPVNVHVGTSEVMGTIVFFDRNEIKNEQEEVLCQIRLQEAIVVRRGDRFILRRPSPVETIGGGWVIDPNGEKYRFGQQTIQMLQQKKEGTPEDLVVDALTEKPLDMNQLIQVTSLDQVQVETILHEDNRIISLPNGSFSLRTQLEKIKDQLVHDLQAYHEKHPMRKGMNKAELVQTISEKFPKEVIDNAVKFLLENQQLKQEGQFLALQTFEAHFPKAWAKRMESIVEAIKQDGLTVNKWEDYVSDSALSQEQGNELKTFLIQTKQLYRLTDELLIHREPVEKAVSDLKQKTDQSFDLKQAKDQWNVSRKYLIPLLELLDELGYTKRMDSQRQWV